MTDDTTDDAGARIAACYRSRAALHQSLLDPIEGHSCEHSLDVALAIKSDEKAASALFETLGHSSIATAMRSVWAELELEIAGPPPAEPGPAQA